MTVRARTKRRITIIVCIIIILVLTGMNIFLQSKSADSFIYIGGSSLTVASINGIIQSLINLFCIIMVCVSPNTCTIIALCILGFMMIVPLRAVLVAHTLLPLPGVMNIAIVMIMILVIRRYLARREKDSVTDELTGLRNKRGLLRTLDERGSKDSYYFVYVDIDDFKFINDNFGHKVGDEVLKIISERIVGVAGKGSVCARLGGGDDFVMILPKLVDIDRSVKDIIKAIGDKIFIAGANGTIDCQVTASVGVSAYPEDSISPDGLLKCSHISMYQAKKSGKNNYLLYDKSFEEEFKRQTELEKLIKDSLENDRFYLVYQPQYRAINKDLRGFETLIRMNTPDGSFVSPGEFISAAEKTDLILRIDEYVINRAMREFSEVIRRSGNLYTISINVSAKNICRYGFADMVKKAAEANNFPYECLEIEITEYCIAKALDIAIANIDELKALGVEIALDDFGTGYASLSYLSKLSIDLLKIDKSFIDEIGKTKKDNDFVEAVVAIGHLYGCHVISEGVETEVQLALLKEFGCDYIQGYLWGKPLSYEDAKALAGAETANSINLRST